MKNRKLFIDYGSLIVGILMLFLSVSLILGYYLIQVHGRFPAEYVKDPFNWLVYQQFHEWISADQSKFYAVVVVAIIFIVAALLSFGKYASSVKAANDQILEDLKLGELGEIKALSGLVSGNVVKLNRIDPKTQMQMEIIRVLLSRIG